MFCTCCANLRSRAVSPRPRLEGCSPYLDSCWLAPLQGLSLLPSLQCPHQLSIQTRQHRSLGPAHARGQIVTHGHPLPPPIQMVTTTHPDVRLRSLDLKRMENGVVSQPLIYFISVYPWQVRRSLGPSSWGKSILALILGVLLTSC